MPVQPAVAGSRDRPNRASLSAQAHAALRGAILRLDYAPGEKLRKDEIGARFGFGRGPVAAALARLAAEGLVDVVPRAGSRVAPFSMVEIREAAFLREAVEGAAAERVAATTGPETVAALRRHLAAQGACLGSGDLAAFYAEDAAMHATLLAATGFPNLARMVEPAMAQITRARLFLLPVPGRAAATLAEHGAIVAAIEAGDPGAARAAMTRHLGQLPRLLEAMIADRPELFSHPADLPGRLGSVAPAVTDPPPTGDGSS